MENLISVLTMNLRRQSYYFAIVMVHIALCYLTSDKRRIAVQSVSTTAFVIKEYYYFFLEHVYMFRHNHSQLMNRDESKHVVTL